jgi:hypothetical protein
MAKLAANWQLNWQLKINRPKLAANWQLKAANWQLTRAELKIKRVDLAAKWQLKMNGLDPLRASDSDEPQSPQ